MTDLDVKVTFIKSKMEHFNLASYDDARVCQTMLNGETYILSNRDGDGHHVGKYEYVFYGSDLISLIDRAYNYFTCGPSETVKDTVKELNDGLHKLTLTQYKYIETVSCGDEIRVLVKVVFPTETDADLELMSNEEKDKFYAALSDEDERDSSLLESTLEEFEKTKNIKNVHISYVFA